MGQWLVWSDSSQEKGGQRVLRMTLGKMKARMANFLMPTAGKSRENWGERETRAKGQVSLSGEGKSGAPDLSFNFLKFRGRKSQEGRGAGKRAGKAN